MLAALDADGQAAGQALQLLRARIRHHRDRQGGRAARHDAAVLQIKAAVAAVQTAFNLDGSMMYCTFAVLFIAQFYGPGVALDHLPDRYGRPRRV